MKTKLKNIITSILGVIMLILSVYMFYINKDYASCLTVFILGLGLVYSYSKLFDKLKDKL